MKWLLKKKNVNISLAGTKLNIEWTVRFLGVYVDYSLKWKKHMAEMRKRVLPRINILKVLAGIKWGTHPIVLLTAYKGLVRVCARSSHPLGRLLRSTVETWEPICADNAFGLFTVYRELQHIVKDVAKFSLPGSLGLPYHVRFFKCDTDTNTGFLARRAENPQQYLEGFFRDHGLTRIFFTDGSLSPGSDETPPAVGFAVVSDEPDLVHYERINSNSTIFDAEVRGVICALEYLKDFGFPRVVIASDSLSVIMCLGSTDLRGVHSPLVYQIKELVLGLKDDGVSIKLVWVPGHCGVLGNEKADKYAKLSLALPEPSFGSELEVSSLFPSLRSDTVRLAREKLLSDATHKGVRYFQRKPVPLNKPWFIR
ncbi:uncharacterized protein LOC109862773, partial [Pseudomyrmex gracilis]|uniref:uncharacterized protein LOC109862773 n=1 Tax=Pseudomyrmex gracilis TaxID=219809 RepID=UPI0009957770